MLFNKKLGPCEYQIIKEGDIDILKINCHGCPYLPSIEDSPICMSRTIDKLIQVPSTGRIIFSCRRNYEYDYDQTQMLMQIANIYNYLIKQKKILSLSLIPLSNYTQYWRSAIQYLILNLLKTDPIGCYVELNRYIRDEKIKIKKTDSLEEVNLRADYLQILNTLKSLLEQTKIISIVKPYLAGHSVGNRNLYRNIFKPTIKPDFMFTRLMSKQPAEGDEVDAYSLDENTEVNIFRLPGEVSYLYHLSPPEFKISEDMYEILDTARNALAEHKPKKEEFIDPEKMRQTFVNIGKDMIQEIAEHKGINLTFEQIQELAQVLVRYTVGFGLIEVLLKDPKIQDISINSPIGETPMFIVHQDYDECVTNIIPSKEDGEGWASKFRMLSGRPLDEANPVLDTELVLPYARARVAIISRPLNPTGLAYSFRRHRDSPWTFPLFIKNNMMNPLAAGLLSFIVDGGRAIIFAGTRSSGKTSLMGSMMLEIMKKYRIITIEDTQELSINSMRKLGYNIQPMKVRSALTKGGSELQADEGIRTSLRMGDSSLIVGEVRSLECGAMYEAMRVGALSNVVAGTIHGGDPYSVYDRVVNDLNVPKTSFKATDIIVISNPVKSADGLHKNRRILQITEVRKHWEEDPLREKGFVDLMKYNTKTDQLEPTDELINGDSEVLKTIAGNVKEWTGNWNAVWDNILLRAKIKETIVNYSIKTENPKILEAEFVVKSNDMFHRISDNVRESMGHIDSKKVFFEWDDWLKKSIKKKLTTQSKII
ncbi:MAG: type II/IV secretion system ATPase subunit [Nanoarchaeota archaeon]|nr:type II/IV secretion system ATPase subunit [Nanoarchaeota archaeon]